MALRIRHLLVWLGGAMVALSMLAAPAFAGERFIIVASTTSTEDSGLFGYLLPLFTKKTGIEVRGVAKGAGEAIKMAEKGDTNVLFVRDKKDEIARAEVGQVLLHIQPWQGGVPSHVIYGRLMAQAGVEARDKSEKPGSTKIDPAEAAVVVPCCQNSFDGSPGRRSGSIEQDARSPLSA